MGYYRDCIKLSEIVYMGQYWNRAKNSTLYIWDNIGTSSNSRKVCIGDNTDDCTKYRKYTMSDTIWNALNYRKWGEYWDRVEVSKIVYMRHYGNCTKKN